MNKLPGIREVSITGPHCVALKFDDGSFITWQADLGDFFGPIGEPLRDAAHLACVFIESGALVWPNGFDASPFALYEDLKKSGNLIPHMAVAA